MMRIPSYWGDKCQHYTSSSKLTKTYLQYSSFHQSCHHLPFTPRCAGAFHQSIDQFWVYELSPGPVLEDAQAWNKIQVKMVNSYENTVHFFFFFFFFFGGGVSCQLLKAYYYTTTNFAQFFLQDHLIYCIIISTHITCRSADLMCRMPNGRGGGSMNPLPSPLLNKR